MPRADYKTCKCCGRHASEVGPLSYQRLCVTCGRERFEANADQIRNGVGPFADHRLRRTIMAATRALIATRDEAA